MERDGTIQVIDGDVPASPCFRCGSVGRTDYCGTCGARREPSGAPQAQDSTADAHFRVLASMESDKPEPYLLGFDNVLRHSARCRGCGIIGRCVDPFHSAGSPYAGLCKACVKASVLAVPPDQIKPPSRVLLPAHSYVLASFENGVRFQHDLRPPEETGLWTWTCSACGLTEQTISQFAPPADPRACPGPAPARGRLSDRLRSLVGDRIIPAEKNWRWENLLCWMDRYQREDFPIPPHWVAEALEIIAGATVPVEEKPEAPHGGAM